MTLKSLKLTEEAITTINDFKAEFQLKNQSDAVVLAVGWARQFFSSNVQVKDDLFGKVKQHDIVLNGLIRKMQIQDGAIGKLSFRVQALLNLNPEAVEETRKLISQAQKERVELATKTKEKQKE